MFRHMKTHPLYISLRLTALLPALWCCMVMQAGGKTVSRYHKPQETSQLMEFLRAIHSEERTAVFHQKYTPAKATQKQAARPAPRAVELPPAVQNSNLLLDGRHIQPFAPTENRLPQPQIHSVTAPIHETCKTAPVASGSGATVANRLADVSHSASVTAVGATEATALYSTLTGPRKAPPGTGGGNPQNPDIPLPLGEPVMPMLIAAMLYFSILYGAKFIKKSYKLKKVIAGLKSFL